MKCDVELLLKFADTFRYFGEINVMTDTSQDDPRTFYLVLGLRNGDRPLREIRIESEETVDRSRTIKDYRCLIWRDADYNRL